MSHGQEVEGGEKIMSPPLGPGTRRALKAEPSQSLPGGLIREVFPGGWGGGARKTVISRVGRTGDSEGLHPAGDSSDITRG